MKRLATAVPGLDVILHGGLFEGGVYILEGPPGVGKTTLANQIAYTLAAAGTKTLYVTMLAESHTRMLQHMEDQTFFNRKAVNAEVFYVSGYRELEEEGLKGVVGLLRGELARSGASLLIVDGLVVENRAGTSDEAVRQFVHELQSLVSAMTCTCLLLTSGRGSVLSAEQTMVDGIFAFEDHAYQWRAERRLQVRKFRGSEVARGQHTFCITDEGLKFFPRLESLPLDGLPDGGFSGAVVSCGIDALDQALPLRGVLQGSACALVGPSGAGKTVFSLAFAAAATPAAPALLFACTESPADLRRLGQEHGLPIAEALDSGALTVESLGRSDEALDEIGHKLLRMVDELQAKRLVVDGLAGLADTLAFPERGYRFMGRLLLELKGRGVTSLVTVDPAALAAASQTVLVEGVIGWFDNAFELADGQAGDARTLVVGKVRGSPVREPSLDIRFRR